MKQKINIRFIGDGDADASSYEVNDIRKVWDAMREWVDQPKSFVAYDINGDEVYINARAIEQVWTLRKKDE